MSPITSLVPAFVCAIAPALAAPASCLLPAMPRVAAVQASQASQELNEDQKRVWKLYANLDDEGAFNACNEYLVGHPLDPIVIECRARCLRQMGRFEDAVKTIEAIPQKNVRLKLLEAECLASTKTGTVQAAAIVDEVAADDPNMVEARLTRARVFLAQGKLKEAESELNYVRTTDPKLYEAQLLEANIRQGTGVYDEAVKLYLPLITKKSDYKRTDTHHERDAVLGLAECQVKLQHYDEAISLFQQIAERLPKAAGIRLQISICQQMQDRFADAIASLEKAVELAPTVPEYRARLADLYRSQGRPDDAIVQYEKLVDAGPPAQIIADMRLAELYLEKGVLDKAKLHAEAAFKVAPENEDVLAIDARMREKVGDVPGAKELYRKAIAKAPLMFDAMYRLALLLARSTDEAEKAEGAKLIERHKKIEQFMRDIERTQKELDLNPRSPMLLTRMAGLLNLAGEYEQAKHWAENSEKLNAHSPSTCMQLAYIAANTGDNATALKYFEKTRAMLPKDAVPPQLNEYIDKLKKGEPLTLPMGEYYRPAQKHKDDATPAADGDAKDGAKSDGKSDGKNGATPNPAKSGGGN